jgi:hypothetical protein
VDATPSSAAAAALADVRRLDSLVVQRDAEYQRVRRSVADPSLSIDVTGGLFHIRVTRDLEPAARAAVTSASAALESTIADEVARRLRARVPVFAVDSMKGRWRVVRALVMRPDTGPGNVNQPTQLNLLDGAAAAIAERLVALTEELAAKGLDPDLARWLRSSRVPLGTRTRAQWARAYVELATTSSVSLRACLAGDREGCLTSLGLHEGGPAAFADWYAPGDYRALLENAAIARSDTTGYAARARCRRTAERAACDTAVAHLARENIPLPLSAAARALFLHEALRAGGPGTLTRLDSAQGSLRDRLATAAGVPLEQLADQWLAHVIDARPSPMAVSPGVVLLSLAWSITLAALALSRRSLS